MLGFPCASTKVSSIGVSGRCSFSATQRADMPVLITRWQRLDFSFCVLRFIKSEKSFENYFLPSRWSLDLHFLNF